MASTAMPPPFYEKLVRSASSAGGAESRYLNNLAERDHRAVKRITRPMLGFKTFRGARILIASIEFMHMIRKGQLGEIKDPTSSATSQFYSLAF